MNNLRGSKRPVESILVAKDNAALVAAGTPLTDPTTGNVNIANGQLAVVDDSGRGTNTLNETITAGDTATKSPQIRIYQGTENSANIPASRNYPVEKRPYEVSGPILGDQCVAYTGKAYQEPLKSVVVVGNATGTGNGEIVASDLETYALNIALRGRRVDEFHSSVHGVPAKSFEYQTPDYSSLSLANDVDHLIQNLTYKVNRNSREFSFDSPSFGANWPVIALAIESDGSASGTLTISDYTNVTSVTIGTTTLTDGVAFTSATSNNVTAGLIADAIEANATLVALNVVVSVVGNVITVKVPGVAGNSVALSAVGTGVTASAATLSGGTGVGLTSAIGTFIPVLATDSGNKGITIDAEYEATFEALIASGLVPATASVQLIDLSTAGSGAADQIVLVALDENLAVVDRNPYVKIKINVGAEGAFEDALVVAQEAVSPSEGSGTYRQWKIYYDNTAGQRKYSQYRGFDALNIEYPDSLVPGEKYNAYIIEHFTSNQLQFAGTSNSPQKTIILVPEGDATTKASLEATLNPYLASSNLAAVTL